MTFNIIQLVQLPEKVFHHILLSVMLTYTPLMRFTLLLAIDASPIYSCPTIVFSLTLVFIILALYKNLYYCYILYMAKNLIKGGLTRQNEMVTLIIVMDLPRLPTNHGATRFTL